MGEMNFIDLLNVMIRKWWLIVTMAAVAATATYIYSDLFIDPLYRTDGTLYVNCETDSELLEIASAARLESNYRLANTYAEILKRRTFLSEVARDLNNKYTYTQIGNMMTVQSVNETELLQIQVSSTNPQDAHDIVESILNRAPDHMLTVVKAGSVVVIDEPYVPEVPYAPSKTRNAFFGMMFGAVLAAAIVFLMELFNTHIKSADEVRHRYEEPVLGEIPAMGSN